MDNPILSIILANVTFAGSVTSRKALSMKDEFKIIWKKKKGKSFEDLVCSLLKCIFPDIVFIQTEYVHDGGKDFYSVGNIDEEKIWVEAKNYNNHLELSKFSNTFIMADISEVNRILIFSMSELTSGAKKNIARYAAYNNKSISVYAGKDVCYLLEKYKENILIDDYIENTDEFVSHLSDYEEPSSMVTVTHEYYRTKQFNLAYRRDKENNIKEDELDSLPLHSLVAQEIHITNPDLLQSKEIQLDFSEYHKAYIESYFYKTEPEKIMIPPASTYMIVIFFKFGSDCKKIKLPTLIFNHPEVVVKSEMYQTECCWLGEIPYMGNGWEQLQNTIHALNINSNKRVIVVEGKSGVGKTRFLTELSGYFFKNGYRIISLDFRSMTGLSLKIVLQNILSNIFVLDADKSEDFTCIDSFGEKYKDFYNIMFDDSYDCNANIDKLSMLFLWLFQRKHMLLSIDNVQDINTNTAAFFEKLLSNISNQSDVRSVVVLCVNTDFLCREKPAYKLLSYAKQLSILQPVELRDFSIGDAHVYLRHCLDPRNLRPDLYSYYDAIIDCFGSNPFVLKQLMIYLKQQDIISFVESVVCVTDFARMKIALSELPAGIDQILHYRYGYLQKNFETEIDLNRIIWSILFLGKLKSTWTSQLHLNPKGLHALLEYGFIEYNSKSEIIFCHQLIEKSFCLFFSKSEWVKNPSLVFCDDEDFLNNMFAFTSRVGRINLCIENMLLGMHLNRSDAESFHLALNKLIHSTPRDIILPLIKDTLLDGLNSGLCTQPALEYQALYAVSMAFQERFDVYTAAECMSDIVCYEQITYKEKLSAKSDVLMFFKNYVFQLPVSEKDAYLQWLISEAKNFKLPEPELQTFLGWLYNRRSKNLCCEHQFNEAEKVICEALDLALSKHDYSAAAEAEIEYGNIFAYSDAGRTAEHWKKCVDYIERMNDRSTYFQIYHDGYDILCRLLTNDWTTELDDKIKRLLELREKTFLYQKLFIDDIYADYYMIQYLDNRCSYKEFKAVIPMFMRAKDESYMHTPIFTILATYKLFTAYRLMCDADPAIENVDMTTALAYELIKNGIFEKNKLNYSTMILYEIYNFCQRDDHLAEVILHELPHAAKDVFCSMQNGEFEDQYKFAITPLSNQGRNVNLLHFNYVF